MVGATTKTAPSAVSVSEVSGYRTSQQFRFAANSPVGAANLSEMLFNTRLSRVNGCSLRYKVASNQLYLKLDGGKAWRSGQLLERSQAPTRLSGPPMIPLKRLITAGFDRHGTAAFG